MIFFCMCQRVWKTVKYQGKIMGKSGNFEVDDKWQPCNRVIMVFQQNAVANSGDLDETAYVELSDQGLCKLAT